MSPAALPPLLDEIYSTGEVQDAAGNVIGAVPVGISREDALALGALVRDQGLEQTIEVGMAYGLSSLAIASVHAERGRGAHLAIDPLARTVYRSVGLSNLRRAGLEAWAELIEEGSEVALPRLAAERPGGFDLAFVDGRHHFDTALLDLFYADRLVRDGGFVAVHDAVFPPVERALAYMLSNRAYESVGMVDDSLAILRKVHSDEREWDHHVPFESVSLQSMMPADAAVAPQPMPVPPRIAAPPRAPAATLSFCVTTQGPPSRVRALLELMRPHADEIVLAVNRDGDLDTLDACADLADRRLTYELYESPSRLVGWALHQCSADWILRLDDDEIPSAALLAALPDILRDRRPSEVAIKRRWLHSDPEQMIARPAPWNVDYQPRLLRNLPGTWRFDGRVHTDVQVAGERRLVESPIYHAALILDSVQGRRERALAYELLRPGVTYSGLPVNGMYVPEEVEGVETEPVPEEDREAIATLLAGKERQVAADPSAVPHASFDEVDSFNDTRPPGPRAYAARTELTFVPDQWRVGGTRHLELRVTNLGGETWPAGGEDAPIRLGYRWRERETERVVFDGRSLLPESVEPGRATLTVMSVGVPEHAGEYTLEIDLVHEHVRWFDRPTVLRVRVDPEPGTLLLDSPRITSGRFDASMAKQSSRLAAATRAAERDVRNADARLAGLRAQRRWRLATLIARPLDLLRRR